MNEMTLPSFFNDKKPNFPFDDKPIGDYESEINDECPNCGKPLSEHTWKQKRKCALDRISGIPPYLWYERSDSI